MPVYMFLECIDCVKPLNEIHKKLLFWKLFNSQFTNSILQAQTGSQFFYRDFKIAINYVKSTFFLKSRDPFYGVWHLCGYDVSKKPRISKRRLCSVFVEAYSRCQLHVDFSPVFLCLWLLERRFFFPIWRVYETSLLGSGSSLIPIWRKTNNS